MRYDLVCLGLVLSASGCDRTAPDPVHCHELSLVSHGLISPGTRPLPQSPPLQIPVRLAESVKRVTLRCITEPFDEPFVNCINEGGSPNTCSQYSRRRRNGRDYALGSD